MAKWQIANPQYLRDTTDNKVIPYYSFSIRSGPEYNEKPIATKGDIDNSLLSVITPAILSEYLLNLYSAFLSIHSKSFAKPYTPTQLIKITGHTVTCEDATDDEEYEWTLTPLKVDVRNGVFQLHWKGTAHRMKIELNAAEEVEEQKPPAQAEAAAAPIQEVEIEAVPEADTTNSFLRLTSNSQLREKRLLEEAKIRAKWAQYKAEKAIAKYVERYGELDEELLSDEEDETGSESDSE